MTFGSFNNPAKITLEVIALWATILRAVPRSCLLVKYKILDDRRRQQAVQCAFAAHGIPPERLKLLGYTSTNQGHLAHYNCLDIALDPFPYNGATTTCDALWMGVPVITLAGKNHVARVGVSQLTNIGMTELIASDQEQYVAIAVQLANDLNSLEQIRKKLRPRMSASPLTNAALFTKNLEQAYRAMWEKWCVDDPR
ncbi:MAG: O-linked N-acetylglucosamine transferase family protein [Sulfuricaulis sp.]